ncbi:MAG: sulfatase [Phycisphaerae bacterium]
MRVIRDFMLPMAIIATLAGCGPSAPTSTSQPASSSTSDARPNAGRNVDPLAGAPAELRAMLRWAEDQLSKNPAPVPLPNSAKLPEPKWPVIRLDDLFSKATISGALASADSTPKYLAQLGPFRSDQPSERFRVGKLIEPEEGEVLRFTIEGFDTPREAIGAIELELRLPFGSFFDLRWGRGANVRIPIESNTETAVVRVTTESFTEWTGKLQQLVLTTEGVGEPGQIVDVRAVRLVGHANSFPDFAGVRRVKLNREIRSSIYVHGAGDVVFPNVAIPPTARVRCGLGLVRGEPGGTDKSSAITELLIESDGERKSVLRQEVDASDRWLDLEADLSAYAGTRVNVVLRAETRSASDVAIWGTPTIHQPVENAPIVLVYLIDTLAAGHLDLYGYARPTAPNMRALAERGVWFANMYATSPATITSVPSLLLGLTSERHRVVRASAIAPLQLASIADVMRAAGFATLSAVTNINAGPRQNMDQGFDTFIDRMSAHWNEDEDRTVPIDETLAFMKRNADRPQFIYVHTAEPHAPYEPPSGFAGKFATGYRGPLRGSYDRATGFHAARTPEEIAHMVSLYDEEVLYADHRLGLFLRAIADAGMRERFNIFVTADHGEEFMQHGGWVHSRTLYNEVIRVPLIAAGPLVTARGKSESTADLLDIMPTLLDMFELPEPYLLSGRSLLAAIRTGAGKLSNKHAVSSSYGFLRSNLIHWTLVDANRWKLIYGPADNAFKYPDNKLNRWWLFDLHTDPGEKTNLIAQQPDTTRRLVGSLLAHFHRQRPYDMGAEHDTLKYDAEQLRELRSLGYVGEAP